MNEWILLTLQVLRNREVGDTVTKIRRRYSQLTIVLQKDESMISTTVVVSVAVQRLGVNGHFRANQFFELTENLAFIGVALCGVL